MLLVYEILHHNSHRELVLNKLLAKSQFLNIICPKQNNYQHCLYVKLFGKLLKVFKEKITEKSKVRRDKTGKK